MVELETMYPGIAFSPQTKLTAAINETDTVISVESTVGLPDGPNYATIGTDENAETIYYAIKLPTQLSGCVRGVEGLAKAWTSGDVLGRNFTAKDYEAILNNLLALKTSTDSLNANVAAHSESLTELEAGLSEAETAVATGKTYTLTHSKSGTVHTLTGVPNLQGVFTAQFVAMADFVSGDSFTGYTAKPIGESTVLPEKAFVTGDAVSVVVDTVGKKLGFSVFESTMDVPVDIIHGGTAATTAAEALVNLGAQEKITGAATTITSGNLTANRVLVSNDDGKVAVSAVASTELGYLDGVTGPVQEQLNNKATSNHTHDGYASSSHTHATGDITSGTLSVSRGGTGKSTLTSGSFLKGNGTSAVTLRTPAQVLSDIGAAASDHTQAANTITAGTFSATGIMAQTGTDYTTARIRNIKASTTDLTAGTSTLSSGDIYLVYE